MAERSTGFNMACRRQNSGVRGRKQTHDKCLDAIKEDLASWFTRLLGIVITSETFTSTLDTGVVLCQLANLIQSTGEDHVAETSNIHINDFPRSGTTYKKRTAFPGSFIARDNVANFIRWCRELGVPDTIMFESDDVVLQKNEKCVLLTLLEVARRAEKVGVEPPDLIRMENEIDQEIGRDEVDEEAELQEHVVLTSRNLCRKKSHSLDDLVYQVLEQCTCAPVKYQVVRIAEGKYRMGEQKTLIFVRVMRKNVMVRVGGGWDTLERYFDKHDPCRMHESRQHRRSAKIPRCPGNEDFNRSPSSLSLCSVSSTDSQDSFNTSSSSYLSSSTWPVQPVKRPRDMTKQRATNPPSSPLMGQSRPKRTGSSSRTRPPRTIETQAAQKRRSKSMHELNKLSVEAVMGPTGSMREQSAGPVKAQGRRQSGASIKTGSNSTAGRDPAPQKPFCSTVSRSSSFGSCARSAPHLKSRAKSVVEAPSHNGLSSSGSLGGKEVASEAPHLKSRAKSVVEAPSHNGLSSSGSSGGKEVASEAPHLKSRAKSVVAAPSHNGLSSSGSLGGKEVASEAPHLKSRAKSVVAAPSHNGLSSSGSSGRKEVASDQDEKQPSARDRSRNVQRDVRTGPSRRGRSAPRELETNQTTPRERSKTLTRRGGNQSHQQNNITAVRERSKIPQRKPRDQTPQRKLSKTSDPHGKKSATSEVSYQAKTRRPSKQTVQSHGEKKTSEQRLSDKTDDEIKAKNVHDSKWSKSNSPEPQQNSKENSVPVMIGSESELNGMEENQQPSRSGDDHADENDEETIRVLYENLLIDRGSQAKEGSVDTRVASLAGESKFDYKLEENAWKSDCLRLARVIDFNETDNDCHSRHLDLESSRLQNNKQVKPVVEGLDIEYSELQDILSIEGEELRGKTVNSDLRGNGISYETSQGDSTEDGSPQVPRRRPMDLEILASPAPRDRVARQQPSQKARESDGDGALSSPRRKATYFDVDNYSRISSEGNSDTASTPESPFDLPRKLSRVQSMISSIESRSQHESSSSQRAKPLDNPTGKVLDRTQDRPTAGMQPKTCATDGYRPEMNNVNAGDENGFQSTLSTDERRSSLEKNPNLTPANHSYTSSEFTLKTTEHAVSRDRPEGNEDPTWRKESSDGGHTTRKTERFPRPQGQFTLEEMIEDMLPLDQGNVALGKAAPQSFVYEHGYKG